MNSKTIMRALALMLLLAVLAGCGAPAANNASNNAAPANTNAAENTANTAESFKPVTVTDDLGNSVTFTEMPKKVAAIMGSFADTWVLAGGDLVAAVDDAWEDFGLELKDAVKLGKYNAVSLEQLFACEADLVIGSANTKKQVDLKDTLEKSGVKTLYFNVNSFEDYLRMLKACTDITGRADLYEKNGTAIQAQVDAAKKAAADKVKAAGAAPKVLFIRTAASVVSAKGSTGTVLGLMLKDLGCVNIADGSDLLENLSIEKIIQEDPDMVFITQQGSDSAGAEKSLKAALTENPAWAGLKAVKEGEVHYMEKRLYHLKPNSLWGKAYEELEKLIYE